MAWSPRALVVIMAVLVIGCSADADNRSADPTTPGPVTTSTVTTSTVTSSTVTSSTVTTSTVTSSTVTGAAGSVENGAEAEIVAVGEVSLGAEIEAAVRFGGRGPLPVGVKTVTEGGTTTEIWYPAVSADERTRYSLDEWLPAELVTRLADRVPSLTLGAERGAEPADGRYPLVLLSHGFGGFRVLSGELAVHLASWGFVVAAPDHRGRTLGEVLTGELGAVSGELNRAARSALDQLGGRLVGPVSVIGHSAGAASASELIESGAHAAIWIGLAPAAGPPADFEGSVLVVTGGADRITRPEGVEALAAGASGPTRFVLVPEAGHHAFTDMCTLGLDELATQIELAVPTPLLALATDGCRLDQLPPSQSWPAVEHVVVAGLREALGIGSVSRPWSDEVIGEFSDVGLTVR